MLISDFGFNPVNGCKTMRIFVIMYAEVKKISRRLAVSMKCFNKKNESFKNESEVESHLDVIVE